ncbi:MAG: hypothetical protein ACHQJ6_09085 [Candidatus Berkiellales bacterium]
MQPNAYEIEEVGNALIVIGHSDYSKEQQESINTFLRSYGQELNEPEMKKIFNNNIEILDAIKTLNEFANHFQDEKDIYAEFKQEIDELIIMINDQDDWISI